MALEKRKACGQIASKIWINTAGSALMPKMQMGSPVKAAGRWGPFIFADVYRPKPLHKPGDQEVRWM